LGDFDGAVKLHAEILDHATKARDEPMRMQQLVAIGSLSLQQGDAQRALAVARTALAMPDGLKERSKYNSALRVAGQAALLLVDFPAARDNFQQLLDRSVGGREIAHARVLLAQSLRGLGRRRDAAAQLAQALAEDDAWIHAQALTERAQVFLADSDAAAAARDLDIADAAYAQLGLDTPRIETGALLARARTRLQDHAGALAAADRAIRIARGIRARSSSPEIRATFLAAQYAPYEAKIAALLDRSRNTRGRDAERDTWAAIATAEHARAQTLSELRAGLATRSRDDIALARARDMLIAQRMLLERRLQRSSATDPAVREIQRDIAEAAARLSALSASSVGNAANGGATAAPSDDLNDASQYKKLVYALPATVALAYFFVGEEETHYWLVHRAKTVHYSLPGRRHLDVEVRKFIGVNDSAGLRVVRFGEASVELGKIAATLAATNASQIIVLPDGPLNGLPFAALSTGQAPAPTYLVEGAAVIYGPSLAAAMNMPSDFPRGSRVAVVSDPVYAVDDARLASAGPAPSRLREAYDDELTRLPYSTAEAREIKRLYAADDVIDLAGFNATAAAVSQLPFAELRVLHFAAHAIARNDDPQLSALHLTAYNNRRAPLENRTITAEMLLRLGMRADLVVLSGCSTAGAAPIAGEGMLGLTHSFLANGSRSVVAALWPVDDAQTARFMARFHAAFRAGASAGDALAQAQRESLAASGGPISVVNWSSFVIRSTDLFSRESKRGVD
jgi:tetratricopeptide (TPR) repeat protein